jgi:2-oxoglutarate/2-oxoacid ferredoxin oxidoreductase subunit beta
MNIQEYNVKEQATWCPGCGNFAIHTALKMALLELNISPSSTFIAFDIGCNGNGADKINVYGFKGLHGRAIPLAVGAHLANRSFTTFADIGDGGCLHEGIDHLIHAVRSNYDITVLIHNNQNFALTTGQATATTDRRKSMYGLPDGKPEKDINIGELVLSLNPSFFARGYTGDLKGLKEIIKESIKHKGCSIVEIMQACPTYNAECSPQWFGKRIKSVECTNEIQKARANAIITDNSIKTGIIYKNTKLPTFYDCLPNRKNSKTELVDEVKQYNIENIIKLLE